MANAAETFPLVGLADLDSPYTKHEVERVHMAQVVGDNLIWCAHYDDGQMQPIVIEQTFFLRERDLDPEDKDNYLEAEEAAEKLTQSLQRNVRATWN